MKWDRKLFRKKPVTFINSTNSNSLPGGTEYDRRKKRSVTWDGTGVGHPLTPNTRLFLVSTTSSAHVPRTYDRRRDVRMNKAGRASSSRRLLGFFGVPQTGNRDMNAKTRSLLARLEWWKCMFPNQIPVPPIKQLLVTWDFFLISTVKRKTPMWCAFFRNFLLDCRVSAFAAGFVKKRRGQKRKKT